MIKLSICIPVYNRKKFLDELLKSILQQTNDEILGSIEIVISDNASTDGTFELAQSYQDKLPIVLNQNAENLGADRNYIKVGDMAKGQYTWIVGSDDLLPDDAIERVLNEIQQNFDIYFSDRYEVDIDLTNKRYRHFTQKPMQKTFYDLTNVEDFRIFCQSAISLGGLLSYLTSVVFKTSNWNKIPFDEKYYGTAYAYLYKWFSFIKMGQCTVKFIEEPISICRLGNDTFLDDNFYLRRFNIDFVGYKMILDDCIPNNKSKKYFLEVMLKEHPYEKLKGFIANSLKTKEDWKIFTKYIQYYPYSQKEKLKMRYFPKFIFLNNLIDLLLLKYPRKVILELTKKRKFFTD
jgi:abequosyltransferase